MRKIGHIMIKAMVINFILSLFQIIAGIIGNSSAVMADGIHTLSDFATDFVAIIGNKLSHKRPNNKHPYGYGAIEYFTSIIIGSTVIGIGFILIYETMLKEPVIPNILVIIVTIITLIAKYFLSVYILNMGKKHDNAILIASGKESHADVTSSFVVLISAIISQFSKYNNIFLYTDRITAVIVAIFITKIGYDIVAENISGILSEQELDLDIKNGIIEVIKTEKEITNIGNTILLKYGPYYKLIVEISMDDNMILKRVYKIKNRLVKKLKKHNHKIRYVIIDVDSN